MPAAFDPFDPPLEFLRARRGTKWNRYGPDILPAWVADMDYSVAYPIQAAVEHLVREGDFGYPMRGNEQAVEPLITAFVNRMRERFDWEVDRKDVAPLCDLVQGTFATILAFSDAGDGVIVQTPNYPPFRISVTETQRRFISQPLVDTGVRYEMDFGTLAKSVDERTRIFLLCNPQNPTGRAFARDELEKIGQFAIEHDLIILSDEIHADLVYAPARHIPIASLSPEIAARTVTMTSATKSFNIAGLRCGIIAFGTPELRARFRSRVPDRLLSQPGITGIDATIAAWTASQPWLDRCLEHLRGNRDYLIERVKQDMPGVRCHSPESTYLTWLDCSGLGLEGTAFDFFKDEAKVGFNPGESFEPGCEHFVRMNFATSRRIVGMIADRMAEAIQRTGNRRRFAAKV